MGLFSLIRHEFVYISYYFCVQLRQIAFYWILGMVIGSLVSVFAKDAIHNCFDRIKDKKWGVFGVIPASLLGIASPLCMYGTIPIAASFSKHGMRHDWLAAFMITGPATKITNLGALKIVLGVRRFILYIAFVMVFSLATGLIINLVV